jgi:hypothetical protein
MAMGPKIDAHLELAKNGRTVKVKGPTGDWEPYAASATFVVTIGQVDPQTGKVVLATGRSNRKYTPADKKWAARATVGGANARLRAGMAYGWAVASVEAQDGTYEPYQWSVVTRLVVGNPPPP